MAISFSVGEHLRARTSGFVPEGTHGIVHQVLQNVLDMYYVQFDGYDHPHLMHARDVERVDMVTAAVRRAPPDNLLSWLAVAAYLAGAC